MLKAATHRTRKATGDWRNRRDRTIFDTNAGAPSWGLYSNRRTRKVFCNCKLTKLDCTGTTNTVGAVIVEFTISPTSGVPIYQQLTEQICAGIARGKLKADERLPSVRELSQ